MDALLKPSSNFSAVRDRRNSLPLYIDIDLSSARADASALILPIAGNSFYIDANPNDGFAVVQFQDTGFDRSPAPIYCGPGAIFKVPFTQVSIENAAQSGKKIRIIYGVDIDFIAGSIASVQAQVAPAQFTPVQSTKTVGVSSSLLLAASGTRKYLVIQNNGTIDIFINFAGASATVNDIKLSAGASFEFTNALPTLIINAIVSSGSNPNIVVVEGY